MSKFKIEVCANSVASCLEAQMGGAYRVELCAAIPEGGTTPSYGDIVMARKLLKSTKLNVIIRPRSGDFLFSDLEHEIMLRDIEMCLRIGVDGVVFGTLTANGNVDIQRNKELILAAGTMSKTFHRAFDMCQNPYESLEAIIALKFDRILSSGQQPKAEQGVELLKKMVKVAANRIIIMPGSGINQTNIKKIADITGANEFHLSARKPHKSGMKFRNGNVSMGGVNITVNEYEQLITDATEVKRTIAALVHKTLPII